MWKVNHRHTCEGQGPGVTASCRGLLRPRLMLSEGVASMPGLMNGLARTFSDDAGLPTGWSPLEGPCEPPPKDSLFELLPWCEKEPLAMLCTPERSAAEVPSARLLAVSN